MKWLSVGIDPGATGAVAWVGSDGRAEAWTLDTKNIRDVLSCLDEMPRADRVVVGLEYVWGRGGWAANTNFQLGGAFHVAKQALILRDLPYAEVRPREWQKHVWEWFGETPARSVERKAKLIVAAELYYPHLELKSGEADALLLARYQAHKVFGAKL